VPFVIAKTQEGAMQLTPAQELLLSESLSELGDRDHRGKGHGLSVRTRNCLEERGIFTVRDLLECRPEDLLSISNFGEKTLEEVYEALEVFGFVRESKCNSTRRGRGKS
jgi:DNA-directed RNA polymerase alpha subunit